MVLRVANHDLMGPYTEKNDETRDTQSLGLMLHGRGSGNDPSVVVVGYGKVSEYSVRLGTPAQRGYPSHRVEQLVAGG